jgi:hypothetical protein
MGVNGGAAASCASATPAGSAESTAAASKNSADEFGITHHITKI